MKRNIAAIGLAIGLLAMPGSDLSACGDKSLSAGGIRMQRALAARYPASILIYAPPASRLQGAAQEMHLQEVLQAVGHKYVEVASAADLQASVATGRFNVVLADVGDVAPLQQQLGPSTSTVSFVAVACKLSKQETAQAAKVFRFLIKAPSYAVEFLPTIADAVRLRSAVPRKV